MISLFQLIAFLDDFIWSYIGWVIIVSSGLYFSFISKGFQFNVFYNFFYYIKLIISAIKYNTDNYGINPIKLYFTSIGGMIGLGNIVFISTAITKGGPGSIFWIIVASLLGSLLKYAEIYLGIKYRICKKIGVFEGGPMYFLPKAFNTKIVAYIFAVLLCLYANETSNFLIIVDRLDNNGVANINRNIIIFTVLLLVLYSAYGGIKRLSNICSIVMPIFMVLYIIIMLYIIICNYNQLPAFIVTVVKSAFTGHGALGGFTGCSMLFSMYYGISKTVYSGDIGLGYDSVVQSETSIKKPKIQALISIYALFTDTIICLLTCFVIGITGAWYKMNNLQPSDIMAVIISKYIVRGDFFMTLLLFFAGFSTIIAYLTVGVKCAQFLNQKYGKVFYLLYSSFTFVYFCHFSQDNLISFMGALSGILVIINLLGIFLLRKEIKF